MTTNPTTPSQAHNQVLRDVCARLTQAIEEIEDICEEETQSLPKPTKDNLFDGIGLYFYVQQHEGEIKKKYPSFTDKEVLNIVVAQWESLDEASKADLTAELRNECTLKSKKIRKISKLMQKTLEAAQEENVMDPQPIIEQLPKEAVSQTIVQPEAPTNEKITENELEQPLISDSLVLPNNQCQLDVPENKVEKGESEKAGLSESLQPEPSEVKPDFSGLADFSPQLSVEEEECIRNEDEPKASIHSLQEQQVDVAGNHWQDDCLDAISAPLPDLPAAQCVPDHPQETQFPDNPVINQPMETQLPPPKKQQSPITFSIMEPTDNEVESIVPAAKQLSE